jgi:hypothetical protein
MKFNKNIVLGICTFWVALACTSTEVVPDSNSGSPSTTTPPTTTPPVTTPPVTTPPAATRPDFLPKYFDEKPSCLLSKATIESNTLGKNIKTTNSFKYDIYNRFTEISSTTEGVSGAAVTTYVYKDADKKIEVTYKGFKAEENYTAVATLNSDYTVNEISIVGSSETSKETYTYNAAGEVISQKFDSNNKSYEVIYTYGSKGIAKSERKNYVAKSSSAPAKEDVTLEWTYGDASSVAYNSLVLSSPNFPTGYIGKLTATLPSESKVFTSAKITTPIVYEYSSNSTTNYVYTNNADNKVIRIDTDSNAISSGITVNVKTKIDLEYK